MHLERSPGYALTLLSESTTSALHCSEAVSQPGVAPEDVALQATRTLLREIRSGGCVDQSHQILVLLFMVLGSEDVGRVRMGEPTERTYVVAIHLSFLSFRVADGLRFSSIQFLRDVRDVFNTSFKIIPADPSDSTSTQLLYSCYGTGYVNTNRSLA